MLKRAATTFTLLMLLPAAAHAVEPGRCKTLDGPVQRGTLETYLAVNPASPRDYRASEIVVPLPTGGTISQGWQIRLNGHLFVPPIPAGQTRPAIVYNHGHGATSPPCAIIDELVARGFIVFAPLRRGAGNTASRTYVEDGIVKSTGLYIDLYGQGVADSSCALNGCTEQQWKDKYNAARTVYLEAEGTVDVTRAVAWLKTRPGVDVTRIAIMGHSYGGAATIFANQVDTGHKAAIDISAGGLSWHANAALRTALPRAVEAAERPLFFLQPENERNIEPTRVLSRAAWSAGLQYLAGVYPPVPGVDDDPDKVHGHFIKDPCQVKIWMGDAIDFLARNGVTGPLLAIPDFCPASPF